MSRPATILIITLAIALTIPTYAFSADDPVSPQANDADAGADDVLVTSHVLNTAPGVDIAFRVFHPEGSQDTPLILHSHGWGGSGATSVSGIVESLTDAGYGVLSFDARGHGDSTGLATIHHKDHEIRDIIQILDWAHDNLEWVEREGAPEDKDMVLGAVGGSYGGGYQLMTSSYDDRLDAIVPQMTWNDLRYSLAPGGVVKSTWVDALYGFGLAGIDMHPDIHEWFATATATNRLPAEAEAHLKESSPVPAHIDAATLLVQGLPDALFNGNEALRNYEGIKANGNPNVALVGYLGGHVLPGIQPIGFMGPARGSEPCGAYADLAVAWFARHLDGDAGQAVPEGITYALEDGSSCITTDTDGGASPWSMSVSYDVLPAPNTAGSIVVPIDAPAGILAGSPRFEANFLGATESIVQVGLAHRAADGRFHFVDDQTAFMRVAPTVGDVETAVDIEMTTIATELVPGAELFLRIDGLHEWAPTGSGRTPGGGAFADVTLTLPYLS